MEYVMAWLSLDSIRPRIGGYLDIAKVHAHVVFVGSGSACEPMKRIVHLLGETNTKYTDLLRSSAEPHGEDDIKRAFKPWGSLGLIGLTADSRRRDTIAHGALHHSVRAACAVGSYGLYIDSVEQLLASGEEWYLSSPSFVATGFDVDDGLENAIRSRFRWPWSTVSQTTSEQDVALRLVERARECWDSVDYAFWASGCGSAVN